MEVKDLNYLISLHIINKIFVIKDIFVIRRYK